VSRDHRVQYPATERKKYVERLVEQMENPDQVFDATAEDRFKGTSFFGGGGTASVVPRFRK